MPDWCTKREKNALQIMFGRSILVTVCQWKTKEVAEEMRECKPTKFILENPYKFGFGLYNNNI